MSGILTSPLLSGPISVHLRHNLTLFIECVTVNALTQHIKSPTRGSNTLDLVFSRDPLTVSQLTITDNFRFLNNVSDHAAIVFSLIITYRDLPTYNGMAYDFRRADFLSLKHMLSNVKWNELLNHLSTVDAMLASFLSIFF